LVRRGRPQVTKSITRINFEHNNISDAGVASIAVSMKVRVWRMCAYLCVLSLLSALLFAPTPSLLAAFLTVTSLTTAYFCVLWVLGEQVNSSLTELNLYDNNIGPEGGKAIGDALKVSLRCVYF
jgi:hypothetical protein